jgi:hypothetical protein
MAFRNRYLIEEGAIDTVKQHFANNWGKYLAGAGVLGGAAAAAHYYGLTDAIPANASNEQTNTGLNGAIQQSAQNFGSNVDKVTDNDAIQAQAEVASPSYTRGQDYNDASLGNTVYANQHPTQYTVNALGERIPITVGNNWDQFTNYVGPKLTKINDLIHSYVDRGGR